MTRSTVVIEQCDPQTENEKVRAQVAGMLGKLPNIEERLSRSKRIFIKLNLGIKDCQSYKNRPIAYTDPAVFAGLAEFLHDRTNAEILVGDGTDSISPAEAARLRGHMAVVEENGFQFVDLNQPPFARYEVPHPVMFRWYELSAALQGVDLWISVAKMKSHNLCGVSLTLKNLFGLPANQIYGSPRAALHSSVRLPNILADLAQVCSPSIGLIDGIIGENFNEWGGDPISSGILIAGDNLVATDAVGVRFMGADPQAAFGTPPFVRAENHIKLAGDRGMGPVATSEIDLIGKMPPGRFPFCVAGGAESETFYEMKRMQAETGKNAKIYFNDRDRFCKEYLDEVIMVGNGKVLFHDKVNEMFLAKAFHALETEKLDLYETFFKLVQEEESELPGPYEL